MAPDTDMPSPPPLPDPTLDLQSFPEILEWLIGSRYRDWAVRTFHPSSAYELGERPSCALMAKVLLSVGDLADSSRSSPIQTTYADALQQLRTRSARRLPEECVERTILALQLGEDWRAFLEVRAAAWDSSKALRIYRKDVVERAIKATHTRSGLGGAHERSLALDDVGSPSTDQSRTRRRLRTVVLAVALLVLFAAVASAVRVAIDGGAPAVSQNPAPSPSPSPLPLLVTTEVHAGEPWSLALADELPAEAEKFAATINSQTVGVYEWLRSQGAVDYYDTQIRVTVRGLSSETVLVRNIRAQAEQSPPLSGTVIGTESAGVNDATLLLLNLDTDNPEAWAFDALTQRRLGNRPFFDLHNVTIEQGEVHDFLIVGVAKRFLVSWRIVLDLEIADREDTIVVDDSGQPFVTSGEPPTGFSSELMYLWWRQPGEGRFFVPRSTMIVQ